MNVMNASENLPNGEYPRSEKTSSHEPPTGTSPEPLKSGRTPRSSGAGNPTVSQPRQRTQPQGWSQPSAQEWPHPETQAWAQPDSQVWIRPEMQAWAQPASEEAPAPSPQPELQPNPQAHYLQDSVEHPDSGQNGSGVPGQGGYGQGGYAQGGSGPGNYAQSGYEQSGYEPSAAGQSDYGQPDQVNYGQQPQHAYGVEPRRVDTFAEQQREQGYGFHPIPYGQSAGGYQQLAAKPEPNALGLVAMILAFGGAVFACIPGATIIGWILLPIALVLAVVSLFQKGTSKTFGILALVISIIGTVIGVMMTAVFVAEALDQELSQDLATISAPQAADSEGSTVVDTTSDGEQGTSRTDPLPLGSRIERGDWAVTIHDVELDATDRLVTPELINNEPAKGNQYLVTTVTAEYLGNDAEGSMPMLLLEYVTPEGNTINYYDAFISLGQEGFDSLGTLYEGASTTGSIAFEVPSVSAGQGVLAVSPDLFAEKFFVAVK